MNFKTKVAAWQRSSPEGLTEKIALDLTDILFLIPNTINGGGRGKGPETDANKYRRSPSSNPFSHQSFAAKLVGADAIGGIVSRLIGSPLETYSYRTNRSLNDGVGGLLDRVKADEAFASSLVGSAAKTTSDIATAAIGDAIGSLKAKLVHSPKRQEILAHLRKHDDIIGNADMNSVLEAYSSMAKFAPQLSTNLSAAKSFLREAVQHEGGIDFMTVKGLAEAERAITGQSMRGN